MRGKFGWHLPPGVTNRMIEEHAGVFEEEEMGAQVSRKEQELVEQIAIKATAHRRGVYGGHIGDTDVDFATDCVATTLKAVVDGMPLPGEERRYYVQPSDSLQGFWRTERKFSDDLTIIVLSPTGTGEEE